MGDYTDIELMDKKEKRRRMLMEDLKSYEADEPVDQYQPSSIPSFLPSEMTSTKKSKKKSKKDEQDADEWFGLLMNMRDGKIQRGHNDIEFDEDGNFIQKKKKKKKKKQGGPNERTDYNKVFETEKSMFQNILRDQNVFVEALQKEFNHMVSTKSSSRGTSKNMMDLANNITTSRGVSVQIVKELVNLKKTISDLTMKERKEFGGPGEGSEDMGSYAANFLKRMIDERGTLNNANTDFSDIEEYDTEGLLNHIMNTDTDIERDDEAELYLKYENRNVTVHISMNSSDTNDYEFIAKDSDGNIIDDYPLPDVSSLSINRDTSVATDNYGKKYNIIWR